MGFPFCSQWVVVKRVRDGRDLSLPFHPVLGPIDLFLRASTLLGLGYVFCSSASLGLLAIAI